MAARDELRSLLTPRPITFAKPTSSGYRNAHHVRLGMIGALIVLQTFLYLPTIIPNQQVLPGDWTPFGPGFLTDLIYSSISLGMIAALPLVSQNRAQNLTIEPGGFAGFTVRYSIFLLAWIAVLLGISIGGTAAGVSLTDTQRLQGMVEIGAFVAVSEELFFRCALYEFFGGTLYAAIGATLAFGAWHSFAYSITTGLNWGLLWAMLKASFYGAVFFVLYKAFGLSAAIASHTAVDLVTGGVITVPHSLAFLSP